MKLGIKVGPRQQSIHDLEQTNAPVCEVWFNINQLGEYTDLFNDLATRKIDVGLHFWGLTKSGALANIAYDDKVDTDDSMFLMRQTIDIAARYEFQYVNIHPGSHAKVSYNFDNDEFELLSNPMNLHKALQLFLEHAVKLHTYAQQRGVVFTVETVPCRNSARGTYPERRHHTQNNYELPIVALHKAANNGISIANDFGHTASSIIHESQQDAWNYLLSETKLLADYTRLIHLGFIVPPYNGTDNHDMLNNPVLDTNDAIPNKNQMIELLKMFQHRDDIWVITEPKEDHVRNYSWAKEIVERATKA